MGQSLIWLIGTINTHAWAGPTPLFLRDLPTSTLSCQKLPRIWKVQFTGSERYVHFCGFEKYKKCLCKPHPLLSSGSAQFSSQLPKAASAMPVPAQFLKGTVYTRSWSEIYTLVDLTNTTQMPAQVPFYQDLPNWVFLPKAASACRKPDLSLSESRIQNLASFDVL